MIYVILFSNLMAILLQALYVKLGVARGRHLAQACRDNYTPRISFFLWILCEIAIALLASGQNSTLTGTLAS
ncbi:MAG: divalent metal cation transporter [Nostoc sp.]